MPIQSTPAQRRNYAPACKDNSNNFLAAWRAYDAVLKKWKYAPESGSGFYNCRPITGGSDYSLHAYPDFQPITFWNGFRAVAMALAFDNNPSRNPYGKTLITDMPRGMVDDILKIRTNNGAQVFGWGGYYTGNKDAMHYEIVCTPADLASGIVVTTPPESTPSTPGNEEEEVMLTFVIDGHELYLGITRAQIMADQQLRTNVDYHTWMLTSGQKTQEQYRAWWASQARAAGRIKG